MVLASADKASKDWLVPLGLVPKNVAQELVEEQATQLAYNDMDLYRHLSVSVGREICSMVQLLIHDGIASPATSTHGNR